MSGLTKAGLITTIVALSLSTLFYVISLAADGAALGLIENHYNSYDYINVNGNSYVDVAKASLSIWAVIYIIGLIISFVGIIFCSISFKKQTNAMFITSGVLGILSMLGLNIIGLVGGILILCGLGKK